MDSKAKPTSHTAAPRIWTTTIGWPANIPTVTLSETKNISAAWSP